MFMFIGGIWLVVSDVRKRSATDGIVGRRTLPFCLVVLWGHLLLVELVEEGALVVVRVYWILDHCCWGRGARSGGV